jgi:pimeloyl-ACP methyl ester carboxylesterase
MPHIALRDNAKLHYLTVGRGQPFLLLHGFGMRASHWLPFVLPLAHRARFIIPDLRGFGGSHRLDLNQPCMLANYADDVEDLMRELNLKDVLLGGISMGALTSLEYQRRYGFGRVRAYVHMDQSPMPKNAPDWQWGLFGREHASRMVEFRELIALLEKHGRHQEWRKMPPRMRARLWIAMARFMGDAFHSMPLSLGLTWLLRHEVIGRRLMPPDNWAAYLDCMRAYVENDYDMRPTIGDIKVPMSVFIGMESLMYPAAGQVWIQSRVPHAKLVRFEKVGHGIPLEAPRQFVRELNQFITEQEVERRLPRMRLVPFRRSEKVIGLRPEAAVDTA